MEFKLFEYKDKLNVRVEHIRPFNEIDLFSVRGLVYKKDEILENIDGTFTLATNKGLSLEDFKIMVEDHILKKVEYYKNKSNEISDFINLIYSEISLCTHGCLYGEELKCYFTQSGESYPLKMQDPLFECPLTKKYFIEKEA